MMYPYSETALKFAEMVSKREGYRCTVDLEIIKDGHHFVMASWIDNDLHFKPNLVVFLVDGYELPFTGGLFARGAAMDVFNRCIAADDMSSIPVEEFNDIINRHKEQILAG